MKKLTISAFVALLSISGMSLPTASYAQEITLQEAMDELSMVKGPVTLIRMEEL